MKAYDFIPGMTVMLAEDQEEYFTLPAIRMVYADGTEMFISAWKPSLKDMIRFLFGKPVYLGILTPQHPPVLLTTDKEIIGLNEIERKEVEDGTNSSDGTSKDSITTD